MAVKSISMKGLEIEPVTPTFVYGKPLSTVLIMLEFQKPCEIEDDERWRKWSVGEESEGRRVVAAEMCKP
ncbi:hypothetical protein L195_g047160 [Trifolium pratense]|uniref:Uncharacterized protein n=1 Tax=Trifolium pratense TaxID=57577 RepID=A0A2K3MJQ1_TRIPR|nr:hypothetical protein L195_g047160 [Trifolium pratense]